MKSSFVCMVVVSILLYSAQGRAQCTVDTECKGDRVCENGVCVSLGGTAPQPEPALAAQAEPTPISAPVPDEALADASASTPAGAEATSAEPAPTPPAAPAPPAAGPATPAPALSAGEPCVDNAGCQGGEYCSGGSCVPMAAPAPLPPPAPSDGWALGGAIVGFVGIGVTTGLGIPSAITSDELVPSLPLGVAATVTIGAMAPIAHAGGKSARRGGGVRGALGLRIPAWIAYGVSLMDALVLIGLGAAEVDITYAPFIASTVALGDLALAFFAADALVARSQARAKMAETPSATTAARRSPPPRLSPTLAPVPGIDGFSGAVLGVGGAF